ncbi:hypothetical protein [Ekhidna sp.]|uniref:hypothetical protein n=1 Tax=Ekhidna sp. TaxID=2608089 RepID=UPI003299F0A5
MKNLFILFTLVIFSCGGPTKKEELKDQKKEAEAKKEAKKERVSSSDYLLAINKIDNNVFVYVDDSLIYTSGTIHKSPEVDFQVDFSQFITDGSETLKVVLFNGLEPYNEQVDARWEISYDLILNGEIVDFVHEYDDDNTIGHAYEMSYVINDWKPKS